MDTPADVEKKLKEVQADKAAAKKAATDIKAALQLLQKADTSAKKAKTEMSKEDDD